MAVLRNERVEMRVTPGVKDRLRRAAEARGQSITDFAIEVLSDAAALTLDGARGGNRRLGWAAGTAAERGDIVAPATDPDDWAANRS